MPLKIIPGTGEVYMSNPHTGDRVINLEDYPGIDSTLSQEDKIVIGNWTDGKNSGTIGPGAVMLQGISNQKKTEAEEIAGDSYEPNLTDRGINKSTHRQRYKEVYVEN